MPSVDPLLERTPSASFLDGFTGAMGVVAPHFEITAFVKEGWVLRSVPNLDKMRGRSLVSVVGWYRRHVGVYFLFEK